MTFAAWWKDHYRYGSDTFNIFTEKHFAACWDAATAAEQERQRQYKEACRRWLNCEPPVDAGEARG